MFTTQIASTHLRKAAASSKPIADLCLEYNETLLHQARLIAACNAHHSIEERFCRWLLQSYHRVGSDTIPLTQQLLSELLGVRRTSVTEVASKIEGRGAIICSRGAIKILDVDTLKAAACGCYETLQENPNS
jgi:CRP-like cAMP-binding protein